MNLFKIFWRRYSAYLALVNMKSKYIIIDRDGLEYPIVFNPILGHDSFISFNIKAVSAGFCQLGEDGKWVAWGKSVALKLNSRPEDEKILNTFLEIDL